MQIHFLHFTLGVKLASSGVNGDNKTAYRLIESFVLPSVKGHLDLVLVGECIFVFYPSP